MFNENIPQMMLQMKQKFEHLKEKLGSEKIEGIAAGGLVKVVMNGLQDVIKIEIEKDVIGESEKSFLEDLILSALNDAIKKSHAMLMEELKGEFGMMIPSDIGNITV